MTAHALIDEARADGLELHVNGDRIKLRGPADVVEWWKPRIVASKSEIMAALAPAPRSTWWLLHFADREPLEVATYPPATHAEVLERYSDAIAAEPFDASMPDLERACSTCAHVTGRGGCGEPVAAGLSDLPGVIRYHGKGGADCLAWLARLDTDLERRILAMAERWDYSGDDLAMALDGARADPDGWRRVVEMDEADE